MRPKDIRDLSKGEFEEHLFYEKNLPKSIKLYVFERDLWKCRSCNSDYQVTVHHIIFRSAGIDHSPENLVTLCFNCHRAIHDGLLKVVNINGDFFFGGKKRWNSNF